MSMEMMIIDKVADHLTVMGWIIGDENAPVDSVAVAATQAMLIVEGMTTKDAMEYGRELEQTAETRAALLALRDAIDRLLAVGADQHKEKRL